MFMGHKFCRLINDNWVLDLTEFKGYKVEVGNNDSVLSFEEAFNISNKDLNHGLIFNRVIDGIPVKILREAECVVNDYISMR